MFDFLISPNNFTWDQDCKDLLCLLVRLSDEGTNIKYIVGNHDYKIKCFLGHSYSNIKIIEEDTHKTGDGKILKILHGDKFDAIALNRFVLAFFGTFGYLLVPIINRITKRIFPYFSLSLYLKKHLVKVFRIITNYERLMLIEAKRGGFDGVIYGHTHFPEFKKMDNKIIANCGCWIADTLNTAIVEDDKGTLILITVDENGNTIRETKNE